MSGFIMPMRFRHTEKLDLAAQEDRQVLAVDPNNYEAHNNLGGVLGKQGLTDEALKELQLSLAIKPDQARAHFIIGLIYAYESSSSRSGERVCSGGAVQSCRCQSA